MPPRNFPVFVVCLAAAFCLQQGVAQTVTAPTSGAPIPPLPPGYSD
jgi:hypothetical protein